jgi:hypothetical protein
MYTIHTTLLKLVYADFTVAMSLFVQVMTQKTLKNIILF